MPNAEKAFFFVVIFLYVCSILVALNIVSNSFPMTIREQYVLKTNHPYGVVNRLQKVNKEYPNVDKAILKEILERYVIEREGFDLVTVDFAELSSKMLKIKNLSSPVVFKEYQSYLKITNPESPLANFVKNSRRDVRIISFKYLDQNSIWLKMRNTFLKEAVPTRAEVMFSTNVVISGFARGYKLWKAELDFSFVSIEKKENGFTMPRFFVNKYNLMDVSRH